jgi:selenocysteine-specific elongation factor
MRNIIVGTAGHIDHGKTSLVKALTGIDADRLEEEKRRGITIDLGFAHLQLAADLRIGFIDVPGHERFVRNMLAGAAGIDAVLFVIAADESIKPQTREHFEICRLLGVKTGVIALTKADLADADILDLVKLEVDEFTAGSFLEGVAKVAVSSATGAGLDELRFELERVARVVKEKSTAGPFRLPIDRSFSMKGFGTVVTGTMVSGTLQKEQDVELHPAGRRLRVRGIQVHGGSAERATAGQRTAVNLAGIEPGEISRGMVLTGPGLFQAMAKVDCRLDLLSSAKPMKNRTPVHFHAGSSEVEAEVRFLDKRPSLEPGDSAWARVVLRDPVLLLPGDRFVVRKFSPVVTIGGGVVVDISGRRYRTGDDAVARLAILMRGDLKARVELMVGEHADGIAESELIALTGEMKIPVSAAIESAGKWRIARDRASELRAKLTAEVRAFHKANPLLQGVQRQDLKGRLMPQAAAEVFEHVLAGTADLVSDADVVRLKTHRVVLKQDEEQARASMERAFEQAGLAAPAVAEVVRASGVEAARSRTILQMLLREGKLVRVSEDLVLHAPVLAGLRESLAGRKGERFGVTQFKEWTGVSRKYAIPLLEYLDREHLTRREGDERVVV